MKIILFITNFTEDLCVGPNQKSRGNRLKTKLDAFEKYGNFIVARLSNEQLLAIHKERPVSNYAWQELNALVSAAAFQQICIAFHHDNSVVGQTQENFPDASVSAIPYSHECGEKEPWFLFSQLVLALSEPNNAIAEKQFEVLFDMLKSEKPLRNISNIKHKLTHLFLPLVIDFQGLEEVGYSDAYWEETRSQYCPKDLAKRLKTAKSLLYKSAAGENELNLEKILMEKNMLGNLSWKKIRTAIPESAEVDVIEKIYAAFADDDREKARLHAQSLQSWYQELLADLEILFTRLK